MIQFTAAEVQNFRAKAAKDDSIVQWLLTQTKFVREEPLNIPTAGLGSWNHYYYCDDCSVALKFDFYKPKEHVCPHCGKLYLGDPYDGVWWRRINGINQDGCYHLGLLYACTGDIKYAQLAAKILMGYATYYPSYEPHGDVPYNSQGKANAQTLCESVFLRTFAYGYDLISDTLCQEDRDFIEKNLLICGCDFLVENRHRQLHNHEVITNSAIGVIGLVTGREDFVKLALYEEYGLLYLLDNCVLEDGTWFECSIGYHLFALQSLCAYEQFAQHTAHSQLKNPLYKKMFDTAMKYLLPDYSFPYINDTAPHQVGIDEHNLLEFAYRHFGSEQLLSCLKEKYKKQKRGDLYSFFYGVENLEELMQDAATPALPAYHAGTGAGVTLTRGSNDQYFLFRHSPFGGEHDHYDRLGISYYYDKQPVSIDLGTCGYGAYYHYNYFKNTGSHNTVVVDEENHSPSAAKVLQFEEDDAHTFVDALVEWGESYDMPDTRVICQWSDEAYRNVNMRRQIYKTDDFFIDVFTVDGVKDKSIDWSMHFTGKREASDIVTTPIEKFSEKVPFKHLDDAVSLTSDDMVKNVFTTETLQTQVYTKLHGTILILAEGPSNPTTERVQYMVERTIGSEAVYTNVVATSKIGQAVVEDVAIEKTDKTVVVAVTVSGECKEYTFNI